MRLGNFIMLMKQYKGDILFDLEHETYDLDSIEPKKINEEDKVIV